MYSTMRYFLLLVCSLVNVWVFADSSSYSLHWKPCETWTAAGYSRKVLAFEDAKYPESDFLPRFQLTLPAETGLSYEVEIQHTSYVPLTAEEKQILAGGSFASEALVNSYKTEKEDNHYLEIRILPIVSRGGELLKLASFSLQVKRNKEIIIRKKEASKRNYVKSSILAQGHFVKIRVPYSGVYKLTYDDLRTMGVDPQRVRIFGYGGAELSYDITKPKPDDLPELSIWDSGSYILFYAQGPTQWSYDPYSKQFTHLTNTYSQYGYYFVSSDAGSGKRIMQAPSVDPGAANVYDVNEFTDYQLHEKESLSLIASGRDFFGETFDATLAYDFSFSFPNIVQKANSVRLRLVAAASSSASSSFVLKLAGSSQQRDMHISVPSSEDRAVLKDESYFFTPESSESLIFNLAYKRPVLSSRGYLNFIEVNARRKLIMSGDEMPFRNVDFWGNSSYSRYHLSGASENIRIWDISDQQNISEIQPLREGDKLSFLSSNMEQKEYVAINPWADFPKPTVVGNVANQNLHALPQVDFLIITHPDFLDEARELAAAHRELDKMLVEVVTTEQVYNEFSSGTPDASAYRWIMKMFYDRAASLGTYPQNLLLFGKGSYDNRALLPASGRTNLILTVQSYDLTNGINSRVTDDFFAFMEDKDTGIRLQGKRMAFGVGRFSVITKQQARDVVAKNITYMKNRNKGAWKNQLCFVADDGDSYSHMYQSDSIARYLGQSKSFQVAKIYLDAYEQKRTASGERYPIAKDKLQNALRSGMLFLNYTGHASSNGWASEQILNSNDVLRLSNRNWPLCFAATCSFILFDDKHISTGEQMLLNPVGGAIGVISAARIVYGSDNFYLNDKFVRYLFRKEDGKYLTMGDMLRRAKNDLLSDNNKLSYVLIGNPALRLSYPTQYRIKTVQINDNTAPGGDLFSALSVNTIKGVVEDEAGNQVKDFNGKVSMSIFDKEQRVVTRNNDGDRINNNPDSLFVFMDRPNVLFSGHAEVKDGAFEISFMMPKDINYNRGTGRINYYAKDDTNDYEAQGYFEDFVVGGESSVLIEDKEGPVIEELYLNHPGFMSGDKVNETPYFVARVSDEHGINTVGSGIGHDMLLMINNDSEQAHILNSYYESEEGNYKKGRVAYKMPELPEGRHSLMYRVWDLLNNSSTVKVDFEVVKGLNPQIFSIMNFPNPAKNHTVFKFVHDRPETVLSTLVEVFDLSGRLQWSSAQATTESITWNLTTTDGRRLSKGMYLYRISVQTTDGRFTSKANKLIIQDE